MTWITISLLVLWLFAQLVLLSSNSGSHSTTNIRRINKTQHNQKPQATPALQSNFIVQCPSDFVEGKSSNVTFYRQSTLPEGTKGLKSPKVRYSRILDKSSKLW